MCEKREEEGGEGELVKNGTVAGGRRAFVQGHDISEGWLAGRHAIALK